MKDFEEINIYNFSFNLFDYIDNKWALIVVGNEKENNCMTVSWLSFGILWNYPIVNIYVRPTRFTYQLLEKFDAFSVSFFNEKYRDKLEYCGTRSGRNENKIEKCNFNLNYFSFQGQNDNFLNNSGLNEYAKIPYIYESEIVFLCKKIYYQDLDNKNFLIKEIESNYNKNDYHRLYIGKILKLLKSKK